MQLMRLRCDVHHLSVFINLSKFSQVSSSISMDPIWRPYESPYAIYRRVQAFVERNSKPKVFTVQSATLKKGPFFSDLEKINRMATPIMRKEYPVFIGVVPAALQASASSRIEELAKPTERQKYRKPVEKKIAASTLAYEATSKIQALSQPKVPYRKPRRIPLVKPSALHGKVSQRVKELAVPMKRDVPMKEFVYNINPIALTYRPTMQIRNLAKPHKEYTMADIWEREEKRLARKQIYDAKRTNREMKRREAVMKRHEMQRKYQGL